jgi:hypothetical protein
MPVHIHLLVDEPERDTLADALKSLKQGVARRLIGQAEHFWQKRYYDFNVLTGAKFVEKLRYIHRNPVKNGLCQRPEDWKWSSFATMPPAAKDLRRSSRSGRHESGNLPKERSLQLSNDGPNQGKAGLE